MTTNSKSFDQSFSKSNYRMTTSFCFIQFIRKYIHFAKVRNYLNFAKKRIDRWMTKQFDQKNWMNHCHFFCAKTLVNLSSKTVAERQLLLLHRPIFSVCKIQYPKFLSQNCGTFKKQQGSDDSNFCQEELNAWCHFSLCKKIGQFSFKKWQQNVTAHVCFSFNM